MNHPVIQQIEKTGNPLGLYETNHFGLDALGNEVFDGDVIYELNEEFFLKEELFQESIEILESLGAEEKKV